MNRTHLRLLPIAVALLFVAFQYFTSEKVANPLTGRSTRVGLSRQQEENLGLQAYQEVLTTEHVIGSGATCEQVRSVARRLAAATGPEAQGFNWQVSLVDSSQQNAFCLPGGKIVVYTGILPIAKTDAGLATVMGHEMSHATLHHGAQRALRQNLTQTLLAGAQASLTNMDYDQQRAVMGALGAGAKYGVLLPFSRDHESEADEMGLFYMARAGFDPQEALAFWRRMSEETSGGQPPEFMSTHPSHGTRIARLQALLPRAQEEYQKATH